jgi:stage II sporulation protein D
MRVKGLLVLTLSFLSFGAPAQTQTPTKNYDKESVRVRMFQSTQRVLSFEGQSIRVQNLENAYQQVAIPSERGVVVRSLNKDGKWFWAVKWAQRPTEVLLPGRFLKIEGENLHSGTHRLPAKVILSPETGAVDVVGVVPLRDYLVGVLKSEMPLAWPLETLKAQAVAARSYALAVIKERGKKIYHLESSVLDQVYQAIHYDRAPASVQKALRAVDETKNEILQDPRQKVLKAFFHADCGGKTVDSKEVWSAGVQVGTALDRSCPNNPKAHWILSLSKAELEQRLKVATIQDIQYERSPDSGRVQKVLVQLKDGSAKKLTANEFRARIGYLDLKSTWFEVSLTGQKTVFTGRGFGHGVGLCQWGSRALGVDGVSYRAILKHYYPLASLN